MRAIAPLWCSAASAASAAAAVAIRREIVARAGVFVRLPFVLPLRRRRRRRRPFHSRLLSAATASPIMGISLHKKEEKEEEQKAKAPASEESQSQSQSQSESQSESLSQSLPPPPQKQEQKQEQLQAPEKPLPGDCCGSGCVRCVWDVYYDELDAYQKALSSAPAASNAKHN